MGLKRRLTLRRMSLVARQSLKKSASHNRLSYSLHCIKKIRSCARFLILMLSTLQARSKMEICQTWAGQGVSQILCCLQNMKNALLDCVHMTEDASR